MACSSRSRITCGVAVAAVIAWRCRGSGRTQTAESPEEAAVRNLPTLTAPTEGVRRERASCFMMHLTSFSFTTDPFSRSEDEDRRSLPGIGYPPSAGSLLLSSRWAFCEALAQSMTGEFHVTDCSRRRYYNSVVCTVLQRLFYSVITRYNALLNHV